MLLALTGAFILVSLVLLIIKVCMRYFMKFLLHLEDKMPKYID